jgi:branched-chain amino acid transport system substrate-binding protein
MHAIRVIVALLVAVLCMGLVVACGDDDDGTDASAGGDGSPTQSAGGNIDPSKPPVRIPVISIKMPGLDLLTPHAAGARAAAHKINSEGGFGGREVIIEECGTELQPATATVCANRTLEKGNVVAEIGCEITWGVSGLKIYANAGVPSLNCVNTEVDLTNEWSFGTHPGATGEEAAVAAWLCEQDDVQNVVLLGQDIPQQRRDTQLATKPILGGCGKQIEYIYAPIDATDFTPYVNDVVDDEPDFVMTTLSPAPTAQMYKALEQAGYPADQTSARDSSCGFEDTLELAGPAMEGTICVGGFKPWSDENDPEVAEYIEAMEQADVGYDSRSSSPQWGYSSVMWIHKAAEEIGFDRFTPRRLAEYMRTATTRLPLSKDWVNPGPTGRPQIKQPASLIMQWKDGEMNVVEEGTDEGWIDGYAALNEAQGS